MDGATRMLIGTPSLALAFALLAVPLHVQAQSIGSTTYGFDDMVATPWGDDPKSVQPIDEQLAAHGLHFNGVVLLDYSKLQTDGFLSTPPNAIQQCYILDGASCDTPIEIRFDVLQVSVAFLVGSVGPTREGDVFAEGLDDQDQAVARTKILLPASGGPVPVVNSLSLDANEASIRTVRIQAFGDLPMSSLVVDDLTFIPPPADLVVDQLTIDPQPDRIGLEFVVGNNGSGISQPTIVSAAVDDWPVTTSVIRAYLPGESELITLVVPVPVGVTGGSHGVRVTADPDQTTGDADSSNNGQAANFDLPLLVSIEPTPTEAPKDTATASPIASSESAADGGGGGPSLDLDVLAGAATLVVIAGGVTIQARLSLARLRAGLELSGSTAGPPDECPASRFHLQASGSARPARLAVTQVSAHRAADAPPLEWTAATLDGLDRVVRRRNSLTPVELRAGLRPICLRLTRELQAWMGQAGTGSLVVQAHIQGSKADTTFQPFVCTGSGSQSRWLKLPSWKGSFNDERHVSLLRLDSVDKALLADQLIEGFAAALERL